MQLKNWIKTGLIAASTLTLPFTNLAAMDPAPVASKVAPVQSNNSVTSPSAGLVTMQSTNVAAASEPGLLATDVGFKTLANHSMLALGANDQNAFLAAAYEPNVTVFNLATNKATATLATTGSVTALTSATDTRKIFASAISGSGPIAEASQQILTIDPATTKVSKTFTLNGESAIAHMAASATGNRLAVTVSGATTSVLVFDTTTFNVLTRISLARNFLVNSLAMTPNGAQIFVGGETSTGSTTTTSSMQVHDAVAGTLVRTFETCEGNRQVSFSSDGARSFVPCANGKVRVRSTADGALLREYEIGFAAGRVQLLNNGSQLLVVGDWSNSQAAVFNVGSGQLESKITLPGNVHTIAPKTSGSSWWMLRTDDYTSSYMHLVDRAASPSEQGVDRYFGSDRYQTAVAISRAHYQSADSGLAGGLAVPDTIYIASGEGFADALAASAAAAKAKAPLLLTRNKSLPAEVEDEIWRLYPKRIFVVGGPASVSESVFQKIKSMIPSTVRLTGADRYVVSRATIASSFTSANKVYIATGLNFPDAVSASAVAAKQGLPMLLVSGNASTLNQESISLLKRLGVKSTVLVGGSAVVSSGIFNTLNRNGLGPVRVGGINRYEVNIALTKPFLADTKRTYLTTGSTFADALSISATAGQGNAAVLLVPTTCTPAATVAALEASPGRRAASHIGGPAVVAWQLKSVGGELKSKSC